jgi:AcrR family transcriptional regulator
MRCCTAQKEMKIAELARVSGIGRSTIHFYLGVGLLPPPTRRGPKLHLYGPQHVRRLRALSELRASGASIDELKRRFARRSRATAAPPERRTRARRARGGSRDDTLRAMIRSVAARAFVASGYDAVRVSDLAREIGVSKTTFYACYATKSDLFVDCLDHLRLVVIGPAERATIGPTTPFADELHARAAAVLAHAGPYRMMTSLLAEAAERGDDELARRARHARHRMITGAQPMFERAIAAGACRRIDPELLAYLSWGALMAAAERLALDDRYRAADVLEVLLDFVARGLAPLRPSR